MWMFPVLAMPGGLNKALSSRTLSSNERESQRYGHGAFQWSSGDGADGEHYEVGNAKHSNEHRFNVAVFVSSCIVLNALCWTLLLLSYE